MEKLLELLNEYDPYIQKDGEMRDNTWFFVYAGGSGIFSKEIGMLKIISKEYGFIRRLVKNDKIDREKFGNSETKSSKYSDFELSYDTPREDYTNVLLMELALSDTPIDDLVSYLR